MRADSIQRILLIRPSALGDVCRTVPVLATLRRGYPDALIDWLVQDDFIDAVRDHPMLDEIIPFPRRHLASWWRSPSRSSELARWFQMLRRRRYDLVIDAQGLSRSGVMALATGARVRVGPANAREMAHLAYTLRVSPADSPHTVDQMMALPIAIGLEPVFDMRLTVGSKHEAWWRDRRAMLDIGDQPCAALAPTARWPSKCWPDERFAAIIPELRARGMEKVVIIGAPGERSQIPMLAELAAHDRDVIDLVGEASVGQTMAVIAASALVIANDSAPLHMAVGFDRPLVALFGPTDPARVGPYGREESVVRPAADALPRDLDFKDRDLGDSIMRIIEPNHVLAAVDRALSGATVTAGTRG